MKNLTNRRSSSLGSTEIELAITLPFLLFFVFSLIHFGLLLSEQIAVEQTAYQGALLGGELSCGSGEAIVNAQLTRLHSVQDERFEDAESIPPAFHSSCQDRIVNVSVDGTLKRLSPLSSGGSAGGTGLLGARFSRVIGSTYNAPHVLLNAWASAGNLNQFENPTEDISGSPIRPVIVAPVVKGRGGYGLVTG